MKTIEELIVRKIEGAIIGIKNNTKTITDTNVYGFINKLKQYNVHLANELYEKLAETLDTKYTKELSY